MEEGLPKSFDVVVIGTGVTESIVSAAASRNGHKVLHLDPRDYYGSSTATLNFDSWTAQEFAITPPIISQSEFSSRDQLQWRNSCRNVEQVWYDQRETVKEDCDKNKRRFNIDVFPQIILAREDIIELLIKSDVSRYLEFLRVGKLFTKLPNEDIIVSIPLSRADIFTSKSVTLGEKRCLGKFIETVMQESSPVENSNETSEVIQPVDPSTLSTFDEMAIVCKLTPKVKHLIRSVVENVEDNFISEERFQAQFVVRCRKYMQSIGRFGNQTPYLWPLYGVSEICQGFCRLSAVYGSIFILKRYITSIEETAEGLLKIKSGNDEFDTKHLVIGPEFKYHQSSSSRIDNSNKPKTIGRGVIMTRGNNLKPENEAIAKGDGICFYKIGKVQVVELSNSSQSVPKNYRLLQISFAVDDGYPGSTSESPRQYIESQLRPFLNFDTMSGYDDEIRKEELDDSEENTISKPQAIYGSFFWFELQQEQPCTTSPQVHNCAVDSSDLTSQLNRAVNIFESMFPGEEFLPKPSVIEQNDDNDNDPEIVMDNLPNHFDVPPKPVSDENQQAADE